MCSCSIGICQIYNIKINNKTNKPINAKSRTRKNKPRYLSQCFLFPLAGKKIRFTSKTAFSYPVGRYLFCYWISSPNDYTIYINFSETSLNVITASPVRSVYANTRWIGNFLHLVIRMRSRLEMGNSTQCILRWKAHVYRWQKNLLRFWTTCLVF
jgi:hypothetical protein